MELFLQQDNLKIIILTSLATIPLFYTINTSLDNYLFEHIQIYKKLENLFSTGININLNLDKEKLNELNENNLKKRPVCIEGIVYTEEKSLFSLDETECAIIYEKEIEKNSKSSKVFSSKIQIVPWLLGSWETKNPLHNKSIIVDNELTSRALNKNGYIQGNYTLPLEFIESKQLRYSGSISNKPKWWEIFSFEHITDQFILPTRCTCSIVGQLYINTDGNYLITAHPDFGFLLLKHINFSLCSETCLELVQSLTKFSQLSNNFFKSLTYLSGFISFCSTIIYIIQEYDLIPYFESLLNKNSDSESGSDSENDNNNGNNENGLINNNDGNNNTNGDFHDRNNIQSNLCIVCYDLRRNVLIKPCNHFCLCQECSRDLRDCPVCRRAIRTKEIVYNI